MNIKCKMSPTTVVVISSLVAVVTLGIVKITGTQMMKELHIGPNTAASALQKMENIGVIALRDGTRPRKVLWSIHDAERHFKRAAQ